MMFSSNHKKLLLMLGIFLCLVCVVGSVAAADVDDAVIVDSDSDSIAIDDAVIVDSDSNSIAIDNDAGAYIPIIPFSLKDYYNNLPVGTNITILLPTHNLCTGWEIGDCTGVELIKNWTWLFTQYFMFKVTSENYNIILNNHNWTKMSDSVVTYNFTDNPFEHNANVIVKKPVNTCLSCSNVEDELIGSDVIQMDSLSVVDDAVKQPVNTCISCLTGHIGWIKWIRPLFPLPFIPLKIIKPILTPTPIDPFGLINNIL